MNREEAIKFFELQTQDEQALIDGINLNPDDFVFGAEGPEQYINDCQNNIDAYNTAITALCGPHPDPITGLVPCGCGGVTEQTDFHDGFFPHSKVECLECGDEIMRAGDTIAEAHDMAKMGWNASHGYTAPPFPGAIVPDVGEMAPNGDEGATE